MRARERLNAKWENEILSALSGFMAIMRSIDVRERPFIERSEEKIILNY
jgi:hypothetical protein